MARSYPGQIPGYPPGGLRAPVGGERPYPTNGTAFTALTGITLDSLYLFDESASPVDDKIGAADLAAAGTPTYGVMKSGRRGIYYDAAAERHAADVNDPGASSFLHFGVCTFGALVDFAGCFGRGNATQAEQWLVWMRSATGVIEARVRDNAAGAVSIATGALAAIITRPCLVGLQVDRTAAVVRLRGSDGSNAVSASGSIAGFGSLSGAAQVFGYGAITGTLQGGWSGYGGFRQGVDVEGASVLADLAHDLGWE